MTLGETFKVRVNFLPKHSVIVSDPQRGGGSSRPLCGLHQRKGCDYLWGHLSWFPDTLVAQSSITGMRRELIH